MKHAHTTYTYTCDMCGQEMPDEGTQVPGGRGNVLDLCEKCVARPISDLLAYLDLDQQALRRR